MADRAAPRPSWRAWSGTIRALSWRDRALAVEALLLVTLSGPFLSLVGVERIRTMVGDRSRAHRTPTNTESTARPRAIAGIVAMASRHTPTSNTCLERSLALWWLLRRRGFDSELKIGARKEEGRLAAHAWVECRGAVINDDPDAVAAYVPLLGRTSS